MMNSIQLPEWFDIPKNFPYKDFVLGFSFVVYAWETYLSYRQHKKLKEKKVPSALSTIVQIDTFTKAQAYGLDKSYFSFLSGIFSQLQTAWFLYYNILPYFWDLAHKVLVDYVAPNVGNPDIANNELFQSVMFMYIFGGFSMILGLPFSLYSTFVIEEKHGFNKQTLSLFFTDMIKTTLLSIIIGTPFLIGFLWIIQVTGTSFVFYVWVFMIVFQLFFITIYPTFIQPLFNKFTELPEGELKEKVYALAKRIEFPLTKLFVVDGSKRSGHSNAYFFGFFKNKRIVLFDTLLEHSSIEETCGVLAHELGHWKYNHVFRTLIISQVHLLLIFYIFSLFLTRQELYTSFGFTSHPILIGFLLFQFVYSPVEAVMGFAMNLLSRKHEFEADFFAVQLGYSDVLASGLIKLQIKNLGNMNPDTWYSTWHYSHPPLVERLNAITKAAGSQSNDKKKK